MNKRTPGAPKKTNISAKLKQNARVLNRELNKALKEGPISPSTSTPITKSKSPKKKGMKSRNIPKPKPRALMKLTKFMSPIVSPAITPRVPNAPEKKKSKK